MSPMLWLREVGDHVGGLGFKPVVDWGVWRLEVRRGEIILSISPKGRDLSTDSFYTGVFGANGGGGWAVG